MAQRQHISHRLPPLTPEHALALPQRYLSSEAAGWEGLAASAFHEPMKLEGWLTTPLPDTSLVLFAGGAMYLEQRGTRGLWKGQHLHQGDVLLRPAGGLPAELRWKGLTHEPMRTLHLHLSNILLTRAVQEFGDFDPSPLSLLPRSGLQDPLLTEIGFALWHELEQPAPGGKLYVQTVAHLLAVHLVRTYALPARAFKEPASGLTSQQMRRVVDFMQAHLAHDLSLEALAQQAGFSPYHFARLFRLTTGESPHQYVLRQRIERAQHLLTEKKLPLAQIAIESGFANQSHFTRTFKRLLGLTPRAYQQQYSI